MGGWVYVKTKKKGAGSPGQWPESKKIELVTTFLATGSFRLACSICKVPLATANQWKRTEWFKEMVASIQAEENTQLDAKLSKIVDKSLDVVMNRLEEGDFILDSKTGTIKRVPVKMRDAKSVMTDLFDKRQLIRKQPTKITEAQTVDKRLEMLAQRFEKFAGSGSTQRELPNTMDAEQYEIIEENQNSLHHSRVN
ncbi:MAG TPA: hypothetical protein PKL04_10740 [Methanofastidiosum sp.]|nr:hypothetical protein [Methanofastidiosum sp.]